MQYGYNPKTPHQAQVKLMAASIDCGTSGHLLATEGVSGSKADDPLYLPLINRLRETFLEPGLLYIGDSKMSAKAIRADLASNGDFYLVPLAKVGDVQNCYDQCVEEIVEGKQSATLIYNIDDDAQLTALICRSFNPRERRYSSAVENRVNCARIASIASCEFRWVGGNKR